MERFWTCLTLVLACACRSEAPTPERESTPATPAAISPAEEPCAVSSTRPAVDVVDGNIVFCPRDGTRRTLTRTGIDFSPSLSPDATRVVFVRSETEMPEVGSIWDSRIVLFDIPSGREQEIARNAAGPCQSLDNPVFGFSDLVLVDALGQNLPHFAHRSVCAIDLQSDPPRIRHVAPGAECVTAIDSGPKRGQLFVRGTFRSASNPTAGYARIVDRTGRSLHELDVDSADGYIGKKTGLACR